MGKIDILLLVIGPVLGIWLAAVLFRRRLHAEFPFFFTYIAASITGDIIMLAVNSDYPTYFKVFWTTEALYAILGLLALQEAFRRVFGAFFHVYRWFWMLFPAVAAIFAGISIVHTIQHPPAQASPLISIILSVEVAINVIQATIFLLFLAVQWLFKVRRRNYPWGIVEGFAVLALAGAAYALRSEFGTKFALVAKYGTSVAYILAEILWLDTFLRPPAAEPQWTQAITPAQAWEEIRQTTRVLKSILAGRKRK
jgi:hypothetical protein